MKGDIDEIGVEEDYKEEPEDIRQKLIDENFELD